MVRLFVTATLAPGVEIAATERQAHYLLAVMRRGPGDPVVLFNGRDGAWRAVIASAGRRHVTLSPRSLLAPQAPAPDLWLAWAPLKREATDLVVRQATELGVSVLQPVLTERTNTARINADRLQAITIEAAEQSERLTLPDLRPPASLPEFLAAWPPARTLAAAIERAGPAPVPRGAGGLLIGPEGGWAPHEAEALRRSPCVVPLALGPGILRAETACVAGLALLQGESWSTN